MQHSIQMPTTKTILSTAASVAATAMVARSLTRDYLPPEVQSYISQKFKLLLASFSNEITITIDEFNGLVGNQLFGAAELYLGSKVSPLTQRFRATMPVKQTKIIFSMDENQQVVDVFNGVKFVWRRVSKQVDSKSFRYSGNFDRIAMSEVKFFQVRFHKKHRDMVFSTYLPHILSESMTIREEKKTLKLHTLNQNRMMRPGYGAWQSVNFNHPATFETLAMDLEIKKVIKEDLDRFVKRKEFYRKVGKAWKRGYLLFGPPGTGKSSLIAAMANYLNFDVYDLELTDIRRNSELRKLVMTTANRSILVVEDIDCSIDLQNRAKKAKMARTGGSLHFHEENEVTLSGLLNFIDGLWSSCGDERIIVFTTNHKDRLDPAILRPGRMDVHIHMSYCTQCGFRMLTRNYLGITEHTLFSEIDSLMEIAKVTPAEVGEQLMKNEDPEITLKGLLEFLKKKNKRGDLNSHQKATEDEEKANLEDTRSEQHKTEESEEIICTE